MRPFVFRATAALDLRRKQDDDAQRTLAGAQAATRIAERALETAVGALETALARAREAETTADATGILVWHRNWVKGQQRELTSRRAALVACEAEVQAAIARATAARRQLRALERLRERALKTYEREALRADQRALDLLGNIQYAARRIVPEEVR